MKCEVLIGDDAEQARKEGKRLERWDDGSFVALKPADIVSYDTVYRLALEQPVPPGDLTATEAKQLAAQGVKVQYQSKFHPRDWCDCSDNWSFGSDYPHRRKPAVKRVPLVKMDLVGKTLRAPSHRFFTPVELARETLAIQMGSGTVREMRYETLMDEGWDVVTVGEDAIVFTPCSKEES